MSIDVIGDFLTIIRNGIGASKSFVMVPYSSLKHEISKILFAEGFVRDIVVLEQDAVTKKSLKIFLRYVDRESVIHEIKRLSRPGLRYYCGMDDLNNITRGLGVTIVSTNQGVMSHKKAQKLNIGGEVICTVW